jgi:hypothetical protein
MKLQNRENKKIAFYINSHMSYAIPIEKDDGYGHYLDIDEIEFNNQNETLPIIAQYRQYRKKLNKPVLMDYSEPDKEIDDDSKSFTFIEVFYVNVVVFIFVGLVVAELIL